MKSSLDIKLNLKNSVLVDYSEFGNAVVFLTVT